MNWSGIDFRHLRYFLCVVEQGSFRAAALRLHVSQPPLTRQLQQLEEALGVPLLIRKPRGVEPTDAGRLFYEEARNILMLTEQAVARAQLAGQGQMGRLDLGIFGSAVLDTIPRLVQLFRAQYPRVEVVFHNLDRAGQIRALRERRISVGFNRFFQQEPDLSWEVVRTEQLHAAVHKDHPLAPRQRLTLADVANETLIVYPRSPRPSFIDHTLNLFHKKGLSPTTLHEVDDVMTAVALVSSGFGVSIVGESTCNLRLPNLVYIPLSREDHATFDLCVMYRKDDESALLHAFLATVRRWRLQRSVAASTPDPRQSALIKASTGRSKRATAPPGR